MSNPLAALTADRLEELARHFEYQAITYAALQAGSSDRLSLEYEEVAALCRAVANAERTVRSGVATYALRVIGGEIVFDRLSDYRGFYRSTEIGRGRTLAAALAAIPGPHHAERSVDAAT